MKLTLPLISVVISSTSVFYTPSVIGEVKSLTSSELTETYIKDSTIIITPKQNKNEVKQKTYSSLTIAPVENVDLDIDQLQNMDRHIRSTATSIMLDDDSLRSASIDSALLPGLDVDIPTPLEYETKPVAEIFDDPRYIVPEGDFDFTYMGNSNNNDLGISREGEKFTFSIGNIPGINPIHIPEAINEGPLQINPREGGGFDLTINIPDRN